MRRRNRRNLARSDRLRLVFDCRTYLLLDVGDGIEGDIDLGGVADRLQVLLDVLELGLAHRVHELALKVGRHAPHLRIGLAELAEHARQLLRPDDDQGDDPDDDQFAGVEIKHVERSCREGSTFPDTRSVIRDPGVCSTVWTPDCLRHPGKWPMI